MNILPSRTPTGVPLRSPTGVRWYQSQSDVHDLYLGVWAHPGYGVNNATSAVFRWNEQTQLVEDIGQGLPYGDVAAMCFWRGKLVVCFKGSTQQLHLYDGHTWRPLPFPIASGINAICVYNNNLVVGGPFPGRVMQYDNETWSLVGQMLGPAAGYGSGCRVLCVHLGKLVAGGLGIQGYLDGDPNLTHNLQSWRYNNIVQHNPQTDGWDAIGVIHCYQLLSHNLLGYLVASVRQDQFDTDRTQITTGDPIIPQDWYLSANWWTTLSGYYAAAMTEYQDKILFQRWEHASGGHIGPLYAWQAGGLANLAFPGTAGVINDMCIHNDEIYTGGSRQLFRQRDNVWEPLIPVAEPGQFRGPTRAMLSIPRSAFTRFED